MKIISEVLERLEFGAYEIKINHRMLLDGVFELCGVPADKIRCTSSSIDKLDKLSWQEVSSELINEKKLEARVVQEIGQFIKFKGDASKLKELKSTKPELLENKLAIQGLEDLELLFKYCDLLKLTDKVSLR